MCEHRYIGSHDGVTCALCGEHWLHDQYVALFNGEASAPAESPAEKGKGGKRKKKPT